MRRIGAFVGLTVLAIALGPAIDSAGAANSPTFRDCSLFVSGFDPDFVRNPSEKVLSAGS